MVFHRIQIRIVTAKYFSKLSKVLQRSRALFVFRASGRCSRHLTKRCDFFSRVFDAEIDTNLLFRSYAHLLLTVIYVA